MAKTKISAEIITFNEEKNIRDCLESVKWVDEIVVVDSFSTDKTIEICKEYTDKIIQRPWPGNIEQHRFATSMCENKWVISLDADERLSKELIEEIKSLDLDQTGYDCFLIPRKPFFMNRWIKHSGWYPSRVPRLFNKEKGQWGGLSPHGVFVSYGRIGKLKNDILHFIGRSACDFAVSNLKYSYISAQTYKDKGRKFNLFQITVRPLFTFFYKYFVRLGFLDGVPGLTYCAISAFSVFIKYVSLKELTDFKNNIPKKIKYY
ncbi:MAG: glycosyltransferase family 2 protein [Elusimicrobiales bacterium]|nr:glycosyltransferase family 2 protein [Elusimicrobiales bacterium]